MGETTSLKHTITICMGSSCYTRGNALNARIIQDYIERNSLDASIELTGTLCEELCRTGPNLTIDGIPYRGVTPDTLIDILDEVIHGGTDGLS